MSALSVIRPPVQTIYYTAKFVTIRQKPAFQGCKICEIIQRELHHHHARCNVFRLRWTLLMSYKVVSNQVKLYWQG